MRKFKILIPAIVAILLMLVGCGSGTSGEPEQEADTPDNQGEAQDFDWRMAEGTEIEVALNQHPYADAIIERLDIFEELTGIKVNYSVTPEENYFDVVTTALNSRSGNPDVFMTGSYQLWEYAPAGYVQDLDVFLNDASKTNPDYDVADIYEGVIGGNRWNLTPGNPVGEGSLWAVPLGFETNTLAYNKRIFEERGLEPPTTLDELIEIAEELKEWNGPGSYGVAVRGTRSWATIHPGYMTSFYLHGAKDFEVEDGKLVSRVDSPEAVEITTKFAEMIKRGGPSDWSNYTWYQVSSDLGAGRAAMAYDADIASFFQNVEGASQEAGNIAWAPPPRTDTDVPLGANLWIWSLAMNESSDNKDAAWLFMQYFTGKEHTLWAATEANVVNPVRESVWQDAKFIERMEEHEGYLETFFAVIDNTSIKFTPQPEFFNATTEWAAALQDIVVSGADPETRMKQLAEQINERVARIR